ncbi:MAG: hypothetical protein ABL901_16015 [Hyphomicrobiaceae bacterium]|nr:hypothetical protein [Hyphomicrobiaceae bacterium]
MDIIVGIVFSIGIALAIGLAIATFMGIGAGYAPLLGGLAFAGLLWLLHQHTLGRVVPVVREAAGALCALGLVFIGIFAFAIISDANTATNVKGSKKSHTPLGTLAAATPITLPPAPNAQSDAPNVPAQAAATMSVPKIPIISAPTGTIVAVPQTVLPSKGRSTSPSLERLKVDSDDTKKRDPGPATATASTKTNRPEISTKRPQRLVHGQKYYWTDVVPRPQDPQRYDYCASVRSQWLSGCVVVYVDDGKDEIVQVPAIIK